MNELQKRAFCRLEIDKAWNIIYNAYQQVPDDTAEDEACQALLAKFGHYWYETENETFPEV